jgi:5-methyltetrahydropteroyltriglutamate--homocysteine methyltransferase
MKQHPKRVLTTHVGSLPRPHALLDDMKRHLADPRHGNGRLTGQVRTAVAEVVRQQADSGLDILSDGEQGKVGFFTYARGRLAGFETRPDLPRTAFEAERNAFPEYYAEYFSQAMMGGALAPPLPLICVGPVSYRGRDALAADVANLRAALDGVPHEDAFISAVAPAGVGENAYYRTEEEYLSAVADALRQEYQAIVEAGFLLQVDDPFLADIYGDPSLSAAQKRAAAMLNVEAVNHALRGIPPERVRFHTCYGINEGPRIHDAPLSEMVGAMLAVHAGGYSFEAANPRHEHEYHVWEDVKLPDGKVLIPGVITHASNIVEHPQLIAERISRYAERVGRGAVIAGADCGFSSQATYKPEVHPTVMWAKFRAMAEGARLATRKLWGASTTFV